MPQKVRNFPSSGVPCVVVPGEIWGGAGLVPSKRLKKRINRFAALQPSRRRSHRRRNTRWSWKQSCLVRCVAHQASWMRGANR